MFQRKKNNGSVLNIIKCILSLTSIIVALFEERKEGYENMYEKNCKKHIRYKESVNNFAVMPWGPRKSQGKMLDQ